MVVRDSESRSKRQGWNFRLTNNAVEDEDDDVEAVEDAEEESGGENPLAFT